MINCPPSERPREKAIKHGIDTLANHELIALILRTGNKNMSVLELAQYLIDDIGGFKYLKNLNYNQLVSIKGIKNAKAIELLASIELARRMQDYHEERYVVKEPVDCYNLVKNKLLIEQQEKVILVCLNTNLEVVKEKVMFIGNNDTSIISGRELFKETINCGSSRIMIVHNHPSGNPLPSLQDERITNQLRKMAQELEIDFLDHIIVGDNCFYCFSLKKVFHMKVD